MSEAKNSPKALMAYFSTPEKKVTLPEYKAFWESLSEEEKEFYRNVAELGEASQQ